MHEACDTLAPRELVGLHDETCDTVASKGLKRGITFQ